MGSGIGSGLAVRVLHLVFAFCVIACAVEIIDQRGVFDETSSFTAAAEHMRNLRSGELSVGWVDGHRDGLDLWDQIGGAFGELTEALD
jgi:hypothetical protein